MKTPTLTVRDYLRAFSHALTSRGTQPNKPMSVFEYRSGREHTSTMPTVGRGWQQRKLKEYGEERTEEPMDDHQRSALEMWREQSFFGGGESDGVTFEEAPWDGRHSEGEEWRR